MSRDKTIDHEITLRTWLEQWAGKKLQCDTGEQLDDLLYEIREASEQEGFDYALCEANEADLPDLKLEALRQRFHYLKHGGEWQKPREATYLQGFEDACNILGVKL